MVLEGAVPVTHPVLLNEVDGLPRLGQVPTRQDHLGSVQRKGLGRLKPCRSGERDRQRDRQTDRQSHEEIGERQTDRQTDRAMRR